MMPRLIVVLMLSLFAAPTFAATVTITASGTVDSVSQPALNPLLGSPMTITVVYTTLAPNTSLDPALGLYPGSLLSLSATLAGQSLSDGAPTSLNAVEVSNDFSSPFFDSFNVGSNFEEQSITFPGVGSFDKASNHLVLRDSTSTVFAGTTLPTSFDLADFDIPFISTILQPQLNGLNTRVDATITSLVVTVEADPEDVVGDVSAELQAIVDAEPGTPLADKIEDALAKLQSAGAKLGEAPPDRQGAVGDLEGAVGDLEAAVKDGLLPASQGNDLMDRIAAAARLLAEQAIAEAEAACGDPSKIAEANQALSEGDAKRAAGQFKEAVAKYKDAVAKAEGAFAQDDMCLPGFVDGDVITYPQGSWGSEFGGAAAAILSANFASVYPSSFVEVGTPGAGGFSMIFTSASAVNDYLPANGPAGALNGDLLDPGSSASGVFGGEVLALELNVDFADAGPTAGALPTLFGDLELCNYTDLTLLNGMSVRAFLGTANTALGGGSQLYSILQLNGVADNLNHAFDDGSVSTFAQDHLCRP